MGYAGFGFVVEILKFLWYAFGCIDKMFPSSVNMSHMHFGSFPKAKDITLSAADGTKYNLLLLADMRANLKCLFVSPSSNS